MKSLIYYRPELRDAILNKLADDKKDWYQEQIRLEDDLRSRINCTGIVDRKGEVNFGIRTTNVDPLPPNEKSNVGELHNLLLTSAEELCSIGKTIDVFWSGGIDSTATLCLLMEYAGGDQLHIKMSEGSIEEYPVFYDTHIKRRLPHTIDRSKNIRRLISEDNITVFANEADTLYSAGAPGDVRGQGAKDWDFYEKIRYGWTWRRYRNYEGYAHDMVNIDNCQSLFIDYDVQRWFINKHLCRELNVSDDYDSYTQSKIELRDIIYYYTGDDEYAYTKEKVVSLRHGQADAFNGTKHIWGVCDDGQLVRSSDYIDPEEYLV